MDMMGEKVEEVIKPDFVKQYSSLHQDLWWRIIEAHANIVILEKIEEFYKYIEYLYPPGGAIFWDQTYRNFIRATVLLLHALTKDTGNAVHTLKTFKKKLTEWMQDSKEDYRDYLQKIDFDGTLRNIHGKIKNLRHRIIAHRLLDKSNKLASADEISVSELRQVYADAKRLFDMCCIGCQYETSLYACNREGKPVPEDIEQIFELIIKNSTWFNDPECSIWPQIKSNVPQKHLDDLNHWRKKFGLPEV